MKYIKNFADKFRPKKAEDLPIDKLYQSVDIHQQADHIGNRETFSKSEYANISAFIKSNQTHFVVAIDARMDEIYWAKYEIHSSSVQALRLGEIHLSKPEEIDLTDTETTISQFRLILYSQLYAKSQ